MTEQKIRQRLKNIRCFVLDMDGTIYLGDRLFPFTKGFLEKARTVGKKVVFFTNNSSRSGTDYVEKLSRMGIQVAPERMLTSGQVTAAYLRREYPEKGVFVQGTPALRRELEEQGCPWKKSIPRWWYWASTPPWNTLDCTKPAIWCGRDCPIWGQIRILTARWKAAGCPTAVPLPG